MLDRLLQRLPHRPVESPYFLGGERVGAAVVAKSGGEEDLVRVDVADAGDELLVHQQRLQLGVFRVEQLAKVSPAHDAVHRVEPQMSKLGNFARELLRRGDEQFAEGTRVDKAELTAL